MHGKLRSEGHGAAEDAGVIVNHEDCENPEECLINSARRSICGRAADF